MPRRGPRTGRRRKRGVTRLFMLGAAVATSATIGAQPALAARGTMPPAVVATVAQAPQPAAPTARQFDIPPGLLGEVIGAFRAVTGMTVTVSTDGILTLPSPGVAGTFSAEEALRQLLAGTGVRFTLTGVNAARLDVATQTEFVSVQGEVREVASPKYTEPLRDTPQTVVVIPQEVLQEQAAFTLRDALRNTPGITLTAGEGGTAPGDNLLIRGFSARNDVYIDGARDTGVVSRDTFNTEAVEVAKGPSSVVTGRGATGGSVNLVTKSAGLADFANLRVSGGTADHRRATADVNRRLGDAVGFRLNLLWEDSGVPRRDAVTKQAWGVAPSLSLGLGTATRLTFNYQHLQQDNVPDYGLPNGLPAAAVDEGLTVRDLDFSNFYGLSSRDYEKMRSDVGTVTIDHRVGQGLSLRNLTRYGQNDLDRVVTAPRAATAGNSAGYPGFDPSQPQIRRTDAKYQFRTDKAFTNQTDLTSHFRTGGMAHALVTGMELAHESQPSDAVADTFANGLPPVTSLLDPTPGDPYVPSLAPTGASTDATSSTVAFYAFDTITPDEHWQVDAGLRWDHIGVDYATIDADGVRADYSRTDSAFSGRAALVFKPVERGSLYAAYTTSFNPAFDGTFGLSLVERRAGSLENLPPEKTRNVELGTKWDLATRASLTAAVFRTEKTNAKTRNDAGATVLLGDQAVTGLELSIAGNLTRAWSVFGGFSLMDSEVRASGVADEVGQELAYVPRSSLTIWSTYQVDRLTIGGGAEFTDGYFFNNTNSLTSDNAAAIHDLTRYWLLNAMASFEVNRHLTLQINGTNLGDRRYVERGYGGHFIPGAGRAVIVSPVISF